MRIGVDLGGTKIEAIALDDAGSVRARRRIATPRVYESIVRSIGELVCGIEGELGERASVGIGTPGAISPATGLMKNSNTVCLNAMPLDRDLSRKLGREVRLANDADCFALSEAVDGAAAGAPIVFGVIVGTGTGGGIVVNGSLLSGPNAISGEWGHNPLPWPSADELPGPPCYCAKRGCIETWLCGPGVSRDHERATGELADARELASREGEPSVRATFERHADRFARALASVINVLDPHVIVLGGGISNLAHLYDAIPARWTRYVFSDHVATRLVRAAHGDASGVRGAAWLWPR